MRDRPSPAFDSPEAPAGLASGVGSFAMNFLADQLLGHFGKVGGEFVAEFLELGPENLFDELFGAFTTTVCLCMRR